MVGFREELDLIKWIPSFFESFFIGLCCLEWIDLCIFVPEYSQNGNSYFFNKRDRIEKSFIAAQEIAIMKEMSFVLAIALGITQPA